ncbi:MFS transporter [Rhizorhapis suberifaciens]|uniref:Na+/melibiose symporter-like transporter n=1 Tax=Rhizorhapis suberifaciens TaxID=13656 RepID=A0A840HP55_9SPHN|nr:MFS transporter [Rhizorhapis suberifaciens]MBB4639822.1 Na+/melibiose symporter-like transporter [Rhizorhapis suberifaciens]
MATAFIPAPSIETVRPREERLDGKRLAAFATLGIPIYAAQMPLAVHLPAIYAQQFKISLGVIGTIFLLERLWGAVADPLIGTLSDRTRSRLGRRRPWILVGGAIYAIAAFLLFMPQGSVSPAYLSVTLFAFYLGWSMIQIPYLAWSGEISTHYHERTRVATYQTVAASSSLLLVLILPTLIDQIDPHDGALKLFAMGSVVLASLAIALPLALGAFPEVAAPEKQGTSPGFGKTVSLLFRNRLLLRVLASDLAVTTGQAIRSALIVFFTTYYMGLPQWASGLFLLQFVFGIAAGPIWMKIGYRLGKHRAAVAGELAQVIINLGLLLVTPGDLPLLLFLTIAQGFAQGSGNLMLRSMVADIADKHRLETGEDRTALFFSAFSLSVKAGMAAAIGITFPLLGWLGFSPSAQNPPEALQGLLLVFALGPAIGHSLSAWLILGFPLDEAAHNEIRRALDERDNALVAAE